ncbi:hypothetical protein AURDEDRAFT_177670 [Auricularia subglabra TFB-10046 SS5]|uniref:SUN domain-containing protein n=1 Tax=Auricularia subglabra (strain TFB-10046 / SS5) TaxID=717982 RepID=J0CSI7_AURST|nr:hypothetical protein AURDEDRAFT_177670 [Auricularia subglabra TFB-10046 SS5]
MPVDLRSERFRPADARPSMSFPKRLLLPLFLGILVGVAVTAWVPSLPFNRSAGSALGTVEQAEPAGEQPSIAAFEAANDVLNVVAASNQDESALPVDHASFLNGARIIDSLTTPSTPLHVPTLYAHNIPHQLVSLVVHESRGPPSIPEVALGLYSDSRALWFFDGSEGTLAVALASPVPVRFIVLKRHSTPKACLPLDVNIWGLVVSPDSERVQADTFAWPKTAFPVQLQKAKELQASLPQSLYSVSGAPQWIPLGSLRDIRLVGSSGLPIPMPHSMTDHHLAVHVVAIEFLRNGGGDHTCFPGFGVYSSDIDLA